jgi:altronate hydrolase
MGAADIQKYAVVVNPRDNVAVARTNIARGTEILYSEITITVKEEIAPGHRFALEYIPSGSPVLQYGQPFGTATGKGIFAGGRIGFKGNFSNNIPEATVDIPKNHSVKRLPYFDQVRTFEGYERPDGKIGTRNHFLIIPTSFCANEITSRITEYFSSKTLPGLDSVVAFFNNGGCGSSPGRTDTALRVLMNYARHPNVGGILFVENGCEHACFNVFRQFSRNYDYQKPIEWLSFQNERCNFGKTIEEGIKLVESRLKEAGNARRVSAPLSELILGTECGGSDAFSGLSGNLALGNLSDYIVRSRGTVILSEVPEFYGAHHLLAKRAKNWNVARDVLMLVENYERSARTRGATLKDNPSPGNIQGGLINIIIKSLGAISKGGTSRIEGVSDYGEIIFGHGLYIMDGPGNDIESTTGEVASGATIVVFTTGRGTPTGNPIVPVVKIANTDGLYDGSDVFDFNAGAMISEGESKEEAGKRLLETVIATANGTKTRAEINGFRESLIWSDKGVSL